MLHSVWPHLALVVPIIRRAGTAAVLALLTFGCGGGETSATAPPTPPVVPGSSSRVVVTAPASRVGLGDKLALTAAVLDASGAPVPGRRFDWALADSARAWIDSAGTITGFETGTVDVIATSQGLAGRTTITLTAGTGAWGDGYLFGGSDNEGGENIVADVDGNVYVAGTTAGAVDGQATSYFYGNSDALVTRFLPSGKKAWTRVINTTDQNGANGIALAKGGGVYVVSAARTSGYLSRINSSGKIVWTLPYRGADINDVASDTAGNVFITGSADRPVSTAVCPGVSPPAPNGVVGGGAADGFLIKVSASGSQQWCKLFTYVELDQPPTNPIPVFATQATSISIDESRGAVYVGGLLQLNAFFGLSPFLRRFDLATGDMRWMRFINPTGVATAPGGRKGSTISADAAILYDITVDGAGDVWASINERVTGVNGRQYGYVSKVSPDGDERLRHEFASTLIYTPTLVDAITYRPAQNDVVALVNFDGRLSATVIGLTLAGVEKWRTTIVGAPLPGLTPQIAIRDVTATRSGDIFTVGDTGGNYAGFINNSLAAKLIGQDIVVARVGVKP